MELFLISLEKIYNIKNKSVLPKLLCTCVLLKSKSFVFLIISCCPADKWKWFLSSFEKQNTYGKFLPKDILLSLNTCVWFNQVDLPKWNTNGTIPKREQLKAILTMLIIKTALCKNYCEQNKIVFPQWSEKFNRISMLFLCVILAQLVWRSQVMFTLLWGNVHLHALLAIGKLIPAVEIFENTDVVT